jgi:4-hydroxyphenylacetate 3-monooxygenase
LGRVGARTSKEYVEGLKDGREVWLAGERVGDVTTHPAFAGSIAGVAGYFDYQHTHAGECLVPDAVSGEPVNVSHLIPRSSEDLRRRHVAFERLARYSMGMLGRTPDYVNLTIAGFAGRSDVVGLEGNGEGADNLVRFQRHLARHDLALTHTIVHPVVDKGVGDIEGVNGSLALHKVGETADAIVVRGARVLATLGPFADEMAVYPGQPLPRSADAPRYALAFCVPLDTPGLKVICRDHYGLDAPAVDRPFSSRFDEQDAFIVFDDVEVPKERVFIDGQTQAYNKLMTAGWVGNIMQQTSIRAAVKLEFAYELATRMVDALNGARPEVTQQLGELWSYAALTRAATRAAEADAREYGNGTWFCDEAPFHALRPTVPGWMVRANDIIKTIGAHNLLATPTAADLADESLRPWLERYLPGVGDVDAQQRARLFRTAWDFAGSALGSRVELYERFYLASAARMYSVAHAVAQRERQWDLVPELLDEVSEP